MTYTEISIRLLNTADFFEKKTFLSSFFSMAWNTLNASPTQE